MRRTRIALDDQRVPLTPLDRCWAVDGRVYAKFADCVLKPRVIGRLEDATIAGYCKVEVIASDPYSVPVIVYPSEVKIGGVVLS